jgi:hypothetical protein
MKPVTNRLRPEARRSRFREGMKQDNNSVLRSHDSHSTWSWLEQSYRLLVIVPVIIEENQNTLSLDISCLIFLWITFVSPPTYFSSHKIFLEIVTHYYEHFETKLTVFFEKTM